MFKTVWQVFRRELQTVNRHIPLFAFVFIAGLGIGIWYQSQKAPKSPDSASGIGQVLYGKYGDLSDSDLEKKTLETVRVLRDWIRANREQEIQLRSRCDKELAAANTKDASSVIRKKCLEESDLSLARLISQYEQQYKAEVIILREQLTRRVSGSAERKDAVLFWYPTNPLGLEQVASGLELLAKQLPKGGGPQQRTR